MAWGKEFVLTDQQLKHYIRTAFYLLTLLVRQSPTAHHHPAMLKIDIDRWERHIFLLVLGVHHFDWFRTGHHGGNWLHINSKIWTLYSNNFAYSAVPGKQPYFALKAA